jgi:sterol 24-C-methyltransferase
VKNYYSLSTDFYEYGWGQSFQFANRFRTETLSESLHRHESYLALKMQLKSGDKVLDMRCGVGGSLRRIAHLTDQLLADLKSIGFIVEESEIIPEHDIGH